MLNGNTCCVVLQNSKNEQGEDETKEVGKPYNMSIKFIFCNSCITTAFTNLSASSTKLLIIQSHIQHDQCKLSSVNLYFCIIRPVLSFTINKSPETYPMKMQAIICKVFTYLFQSVTSIQISGWNRIVMAIIDLMSFTINQVFTKFY